MPKETNKICYNCKETLIIDFYWIHADPEETAIQHLEADCDRHCDYEQYEFEVCANCNAAV